MITYGMIAGFLASVGVRFLPFRTKSILLGIAYKAPRATALPTLPKSFYFDSQKPHLWLPRLISTWTWTAMQGITYIT